MASGPEKDVSEVHEVESIARVRLRNILCATDFSGPAGAALTHATALARRYEAKVYVAHVIRPDYYQLVPTAALESALAQTRLYAEKQMADLLLSGRLEGIEHEVLIGHGELWPVLSGMVAEREIDLIVVGTHGRTGVPKLLLGSAAEEIFRLAACPVLTVGPRVAPEVPVEADPRRILYATDFTPTSERAASYAISLAQEHQAQLTLLYVIQESLAPSEHNRKLLDTFFVKRLESILPPDADLWCKPETLVTFGTPADGILKAATQCQADLVVLGVRRSGAFPGHLPPATSYRVVCAARCPVLTIRG